MRIRKRFPPSSSLSSPPLSDPQLNRSLVVQPLMTAHPHVNLYAQEGVKTNPYSSDPQNQPCQHPTVEETLIGSEKLMLASPPSRTEGEQMKEKEIEGEEIKDERRKKEEEKSGNDIRKESILSAEMDKQFTESSSSSYQADKWCKGDKVVPLKKRKGRFERILIEESTTTKAKMKSKTNKKCLKQNVEEETKKETSKEGFDCKNSMNGSAKKNKRGNVIMEGSRCSRVNGRGWRCCQQTLVGYSLCEHHLGKGRLRSMTSVPNHAMIHMNAEKKDETARLSNLQKKQEMKSSSSNKDDAEVNDDDDEGKPLMVTKKRMKLGAVKARSISSLLGQTENAANSNKFGNSG